MSASDLVRLLLAAALACESAGVRADPVASEPDLKAAIVFNLAIFTEWPARAFSAGQPLTLCYSGERLAPAFGALAGRTVNGRALAVRRIASQASPAGCHLAYWLDEAEMPADAGLERQPVLAISDSKGFAARGGMIELSVVQARITFEMNVASSRAAGLKVSSKLLRLARKVYGNEE